MFLPQVRWIIRYRPIGSSDGQLISEIERARSAIRKRDWGEAYKRLDTIGVAALGPAELDQFADAAWWVSRVDDAIALRQQAEAAHASAGDRSRAAYAAWLLYYDHVFRGEYSIASGWLERARRHLSSEAECLEHGFLAFAEGEEALARDDLSEALKLAERALEIGQRHTSHDLSAMAIQLHGRVLISQGHVAEGTRLLDEAMTSVVADRLSPLFTGWVYCQVVTACLELADLGRAGEWTRAAEAWCETLPSGTPYHGLCRLRRAEVMSLEGRWPEAESEALLACDELMAYEPRCAADAFYVAGEIRQRMGDPAAAARAFARSQELGRDPHPGMALLRLADGDPHGAATSIRLSLAAAPRARLVRARLLAARVEASLAAADLRDAQSASAELDRLAAQVPTPALEAMAASASGSIRLSEGDAAGALESLRRAWSLWVEMRLPFEAAQTRVLVGIATRLGGDDATGVAEIRAAAQAFDRLGATWHARRALERLKQPTLPAGLTEREVEVLRLVVAGRTNREIASDLVISRHTVDRHLQNIFAKIGVSSRAAATAFALEHRLA